MGENKMVPAKPSSTSRMHFCATCARFLSGIFKCLEAVACAILVILNLFYYMKAKNRSTK